MRDPLNNAKIRTISLLLLVIIWSVILVIEFNENAHILVLIADVFVLMFIIVLFFLSFRLPSIVVKSVQQVENEITEIENSKKST